MKSIYALVFVLSCGTAGAAPAGAAPAEYILTYDARDRAALFQALRDFAYEIIPGQSGTSCLVRGPRAMRTLRGLPGVRTVEKNQRVHACERKLT